MILRRSLLFYLMGSARLLMLQNENENGLTLSEGPLLDYGQCISPAVTRRSGRSKRSVIPMVQNDGNNTSTDENLSGLLGVLEDGNNMSADEKTSVTLGAARFKENLLKELATMKSDKEKLNHIHIKWGSYTIPLMHEFEKFEGVVDAIMGHEAVQSFLTKFVKNYVPKREPGVTYTKSKIEQAYLSFLTDPENDVGKTLMVAVNEVLPYMDAEKLATSIKEIYRKSSFVMGLLPNLLINLRGMEGVFHFIRLMPIPLNDEEKLVVEKMAAVDFAFVKSSTNATTLNP